MLVGAGTIYQQSYVGAKGDWIKSRHFRFYLDYPGSAQDNGSRELKPVTGQRDTDHPCCRRAVLNSRTGLDV
ncbi:MAG: hypothetical protein WStaPseu_03410 [Shewanella algae]